MQIQLPWWKSGAVLLAASLTFTVLATAQEADPPSRVARLAYMAGPVSFEPASVDQWTAASLNYPMTTGDNLYTDNGARAVLRIGQNSIRLNSMTNFQFVNLSDNIVQTSINSGGLSLRLRHLFDSESWEVDTPNGAVTLLRTGEYRVDTDPAGNATMVTVRAGDALVTANEQSFPVHAGQSAYVDNSGNPPDIQDINQPDDFDAFISNRDRIEDVPVPQYVSPDMVGYEDLQANGRWSNTPDYGYVWTPNVSAGWVPYRDGHWAWVEPWGWTWVDDAPWGFAPFHYGRWANLSGTWVWAPGPPAPRPYYAPALVAFVGGGGFSVGVSVGGGGGGGLVGWFPLGPSEAYYPAYHVSPRYVQQVNITNTRINVTNINITNVNVTNVNYVNRAAVIAVPQNSFISAQPVNRVSVRVDVNVISRAQVIGAAPRVAPQIQSVTGPVGARPAVAPPAALASRPVVARLTPPPQPVSFVAKQQILAQHPGTPVAPAQLQEIRVQASYTAAPSRVQVRTVNAQQVHPVTPTVRQGPAQPLTQRIQQTPPQSRPNPSQPQNQQVTRPANQAPPAGVRPGNFPNLPGGTRPAQTTPTPAAPVNRPQTPAPTPARPATPVTPQAVPPARPQTQQPQAVRPQQTTPQTTPPPRQMTPETRPQQTTPTPATPAHQPPPAQARPQNVPPPRQVQPQSEPKQTTPKKTNEEKKNDEKKE